jgi:hypothetical protein
MIPAFLLMVAIIIPPGGIHDPSVRAIISSAEGDDDIDYAIITTQDLATSFEPLRSWRSQTGLKAAIYLLDGSEGILQGEGSDNAEKLFNFITGLHDQTGGKLRYVLLGGDSDLVPVRYLHADAAKFEMDDTYLSDVYYSSPGLDWDTDGDFLYGERSDIEAVGVENLTFSINVGRAPVKNTTESDRFVSNVISYETTPPEGDWTGRGIISSSLMDVPNRMDDPLTPEDEGYNSYKDNGYKAIENYTMAYMPRSMDLVQVHDYTNYEGGEYSGENDTLGEGTLSDLLSQGASFFTFAGQSYYDVEYPVSPVLAYSLANWFDPNGTAYPPGNGFQPALTHEDTWALTNGGKLPVAYISSCDSANFSDPDGLDLSNMVYAPEGGAICLIGSTGISWRGEGADYSLGNWYLMSRFWQNYMSSNRPADSLYKLKNDYIASKWDELASKEAFLVGLYAYNYLGDPALTGWLGDPRELTVTAGDDSQYASGDFYDIEIRNGLGTPVSNAMVSIYMESTDELFTGYTGPDGKASIPTHFSNGGSAKATITSRNYLPLVRDIDVNDEPVDLSVVPGSLGHSPVRPTEGSEMTITAEVKNSGSTVQGNITVSLFDVEISDPSSDLPPAISTTSLDLQGSGTSEVSFKVFPLRSWKRLWVVVIPEPGEIDISDNVAHLDIEINAKPRFLPMDMFEVQEDPDEPGEMDLRTVVFDPDQQVLQFQLVEGAPNWITIQDDFYLTVAPPLNYSGIVSVGLRVWDGLAQDTTTLDIFISSVNDPPGLVDLASRYQAVVDSPFTLRLDIIDAEGDDVDIELRSDLPSLSVTGNMIRFVPYMEDVGDHEVAIKLVDPLGANSTYGFTLEVVSSMDRLYFTEPSMHLPDAYSGSRYSHTISIGGDLSSTAVFEDNTTLFDIEPGTGKISFTPSDGDVGEHWIRITARSGNVTIERSFILEVRESREIPMLVLYGLGIGIVVLIAVFIGIYLWSGTKMEQYGLEE